MHQFQVITFLNEQGLSQYTIKLLSQGFDDMQTLSDIQEMDLDALNMKLGHRRKLQRALATLRGVSLHEPLNVYIPYPPRCSSCHTLGQNIQDEVVRDSDTNIATTRERQVD
jgi:hypothetical protein